MSKKAFIFPGQGAQYPGMGKDFYENFPLARETFEEADDILRRNLTKIILNGPEDTLTETKNSQVGIFVVSMAILKVLKDSLPEMVPFACSGLSLGEYSAMCASGRLSFSECLKLVDLRGRFMNDACESHPGTMAVVLGLEASVVEELSNETENLWSANFNCPGQVVIAGTVQGIEMGKDLAIKRGAKRVLPLKVHGAFHSGLMQQASDGLEPHLQKAAIEDSSVEIVMNVPGDFVKEPKQIIQNLILQVTKPVRWEQGVRQMVERGVDSFFEIGCGKTLAGFNKRIGVAQKTVNIETIKDLEELAK